MDVSFEEALKKAAAYCSKKEKCAFDVESYLRKYGINDEIHISKIIETLRTEKFIDEERYVKAFIHDKFKFNKWGKRKIRYALLAKNIKENLIDELLEKEIDFTEYKAVLKKILLEKKKSLKKIDRNVLKQKISNFALSKGYEPHLIKNIVESIMK